MLSNKFFTIKRNTTPDQIINVDGRGYSMDLKHMPVSPQGYRYILVFVSNHTREIDAVPLKDKTMSTCTRALELILKRKYIRSLGNIRTISVDKGSEFVNKDMKAFLDKKGIQLIVENTTTHINATSIVESMINVITKNVNIYLTKMSYDTGKKFTDWLPSLEQTVFETNNSRRLNKDDIVITPQQLVNMPVVLPKDVIPIGQKVYKFIPYAENFDGSKTFRFRNGSLRFNPRQVHTVTSYLLRHGRPLRFFLNNDMTVSYLRHQLLANYEI